ncbi:hypothetical protein NSK_008568 [Nannochloropsis salina CCMP1776]|uniref:Mitochondrial carrier protein n=1 Tax=Nannochloropsis salina CCMP1776 TaxID=1027361 RepID=A0A4D9CLN0_9STRA|nr:hypothetical protein NSK_008568 [Nannochloropsis salina CCMP1776]|eukprot:TFJ80010.1 hypothetical protein NSK_008568 [Nannochloropsis salina CCMP1776]
MLEDSPDKGCSSATALLCRKHPQRDLRNDHMFANAVDKHAQCKRRATTLCISSNTAPKGYSAFAVSLVAGGGAGVIETILTYPLDLVRTRLQMLQDTTGNVANLIPSKFPRRRHSPGIIRLLASIAQEEGFLRLYRGLLPPLISEVPRRALKFSANEFYTHQGRAFLKKWSGISSPSFPVLLAAVAGTLTGLTETLLHTPFELLKTRLQSREFQHCRDAHACAQEVWAQGGRVQGGWRRLLAFYQGWEAYLWRQGVWNGVFFTSIAAIRTHAPLALFLPASSAPTTSPRSTASVQCSLSSPSSCPAPPLKLSPLPSPLTSSSSFAFPLVFLSTARVYDFVTGLLAGTVATLLNTPFDVCKTRLQCVTYSRTGGCGGRDGGASLPWVLPYLREICKKEGLRGCFRGLNARLCRAAPGSGILLVAYEGIAKLMRLEEPM